MRLLLRLLILNVALCNVIAAVLNLNATKEPLTPKDVEFVEIIKKDLRRNNDDYADALYDIRNKTVTTGNMKHATAAVTTLQGTTDINRIKGVRRDYNDLGENNYDSLLQVKHDLKTNATQTNEANKRAFMKKINRMVPTHTLASLVRNISKATTLNKPVHDWKIKRHSKLNTVTLKTISRRKLTPETTISLTTKLNSIETISNKNKMERFKDLMKKNKGLFKKFVSSKLERTQIQMASPALNAISSMKKSIYRREKAERAGGESDAALPDPDLLDMAPAKGGRINQKRLKGRLCHRHVLMPEGPKYDSRGRWYLAAHGLVARRPYERTRRPTLLLPRCCNCCKKSVLGCE